MKNKIIRNMLLTIITNNLGKVEETEDKIICHVKKYKCKQNSYQFTIACHGQRKEYQELVEKYNLNKPIVYIIDNFEIKNKKVFIFGYNNPEIIIKNCAFLFELSGHINGNCTLEHTFVRTFSTFMFGANKLTLKNMSVTNPFSTSNSLHIALGGEEKLEIINSTIGKEKQSTHVNLTAKDEIIINSSNIGGNTIEINTQSIKGDKDSKIKASESIKINANEYSDLNIITNNANINGIEFDTKNQIITLKMMKDNEELQKAKLIDILRRIKENCEQRKKELLEEYSNKLEKQKIYKLTK